MIDIYWRGRDGSVWDLIRGPVRITADALENLLGPAASEQRVRETATRDGQVRTGGRRLARYPVVPVLLFTEGTSGDFWSLYDSWTSTLHEEQTGQFVVVNTDTGRVLELTVAVSQWPDDPAQDPSTRRRQRFVYTFVANDPYWYLPTVSLEFASASSVPVSYYPGYPFRRTAGRQAGRVRVDNPGTEPVPWVARFPSPSAGFALTIDGHRVAGTIPVPEGSFLELDSKATAAYLVRGGTRTHIPWGQLESFDWAQLQPGTASEVQITNQGAGVPSLTFRPKRREAL